MENEEILKEIRDIRFWPRGVSVLHYYKLHFTEKRIIWELIDENPRIPVFYHRGALFLLPILFIAKKLEKNKMKAKAEYNSEFGVKKNLNEILEDNLKNFDLEYWQIENVVIKKGKFKMELMRDYPLIKKKHTFYFPKEKQYDVESIFLKMMPTKTKTKPVYY
jgi:hypothetical protein